MMFISTRQMYQSVRFQFVSVIIFMAMAVVFPPYFLMAKWSTISETIWLSQSLYSFALSVLGSGISLWLLNGITRYPGINMGAYVLPAFLVSIAAIVLAIFFLRIDYSRYVIITAFVAGYSWLQLLFYIRDRVVAPTLSIIPGGTAENLINLDAARWNILAHYRDKLPEDSGVVADLDADLSSEWERFIASCTLEGIPVYDVKTIAENLSGKAEINHLSETAFGSLLPSNTYLRSKRSIDIVVAIALLPFFITIICIIAIAVKFESEGPAFFFQPRMGFRGRIFNIYKIRSMRTDVANGEAFTVENDPRITKVGRFIRKYRFDEFPQIFNIIKGDMSWIGPRPEARELSEWYAREIPYYVYRHAVRPGISGWAQVNQGNVAQIDAATEKLRYDFYYIKHFSPFLDILIVLRTIHAMITGFGSK